MSTTASATASFDPRSHDFLMDPHAALQGLLAEHPVFFHEPVGAYVVLPYEEGRRALTDYETYSSVAYKTMPVRPELRDRIPSEWERVGQVIQGGQILNMDPPAHTPQRRAMQRTFTHRRIQSAEDGIAAIADGLIDGFIEQGSCDLMQDYAMRLTLQVIGSMLALPEDLMHGISSWIIDVFMLLAPIDMRAEDVTAADDDLVATYDRVHRTYGRYMELIEERRANPGEDLASAMLAITDDDGAPALTNDEVLAHMVGITAAGIDTTANLIVNMVRFFTESPDQLAAVQSEPGLWTNAVDEGLRRAGIAVWLFRTAIRDSVLCGVEIPSGSKVAAVIPGANADPSKFPDPLRFDVRRENAGEHLAFGRGRHFCLGAPLAPPEARIALEALYRRLPELRADLDQELEFLPALSVRAIISQRATWRV